MKVVYTFTPKEGAGRSNRLGDANKSRGLAIYGQPFAFYMGHLLGHFCM